MLKINPVRIDQVTQEPMKVYQLDPKNWWHRFLIWAGGVRPTLNNQEVHETFTEQQNRNLLAGLREATANFRQDTGIYQPKTHVIIIGQKEFHELTGMTAKASWDLSVSGVVGNFLPKYQGFEIHICRHISGYGLIEKKVIHDG